MKEKREEGSEGDGSFRWSLTQTSRAHLLRLCSRHGNDAADALGDGLLGDDDEGRGVSRVLQVAADKSSSRTQA